MNQEYPFNSSAVQEEYLRWYKKIDLEDYSSKSTFSTADVLLAHFAIVDYFESEYEGKGLGGVGPKDLGLLESAVARQITRYGTHEKWESHFEKLATLVFGISRNHVFQDANKRTCFLLILWHFDKNNRVIDCEQKDLEDLLVEMVSGGLDRYPAYKKLVKKNVQDAEIKFVASRIKSKSRSEDKRHPTINFKQLDNRLREFGYALENPSRGYIDIIKIEDKRRWVIGAKYVYKQRIATIGFPGWKKRVSRHALGHVRELTNLTSREKDDTKVFLGDSPIPSIIDDYRTPLERLADR